MSRMLPGRSPQVADPAEETGDVATHDDKAADAQAEKVAAPVGAAGSPADTAETKLVTRRPAAADKPEAGGPPASTMASQTKANQEKAVEEKAVREKKDGPGKAKVALSAVGWGVARVRNLIASLVWLAAVVAAAVLALGALFTALDQANQSNEIVSWVVARGHDLVGPFKDLFRLQTAKNTLLVNWGIAALAYLVGGKLVERFIRP
jgi:hypothetical protein